MRASTFACLATSLVVLAASPAMAATLRWTRVDVQARTTDGCFVLAESIMRNTGYSDVRYAAPEVTGRRGSTYVAVTCIATQPMPTAVVMAVGDDEAEVARTRTDMAQRLRTHKPDPRDPL